jgi:two-component sensor histidine kinase
MIHPIPKIFIKAFIGVFTLVFIYFFFVFVFFIPKIEKSTKSLENSIGKVQLEKTLQIIHDSASELEDYKELLLQQHKTELEKLTDVIWHLIQAQQQEHKDVSLHILQTETLNLIKKLQYGHHDYFYVSDYNFTIISHPYLQNKNFSKVTDVNGNLVVPPLVKIAREKGSGFYRYWWKKNNRDGTPYEKLTYAKDFAPWKWVIGTGVYLDDIQQGVILRRKKLINKLKIILHSTKIGDNGYVYIFDSKGNMIIHPNKNLEGKNFKKWQNPGKKSYIFDDLVNAYFNGNKILYYNWDRPNDKGNYHYKKISWIEYDAYFDWYVCSSGYLNEFHQASNSLRKFIIYFVISITILLTILSLFFFRQIIRPAVELSKNAQEVINGNFKVRYKGKISKDEIGLLALQFNKMLDTINEQISTLDTKVSYKTKILSDTIHEKNILLKELNHRVKNNMYVINSIIGLQAFQENTTDVHAFIESIQHRIHSMALGHELLNKTNSFDKLNVQEYIPQLVDSLINAYIKHPDKCHCIYDLDYIILDIDKLLSCGLIVNELVTNSIKYAFKPDNNTLIVSFKKEGNKLSFSVYDHGKCFDIKEKKGIGLELVEMLVSQLDGSLHYECKNGSYITINFS